MTSHLCFFNGMIRQGKGKDEGAMNIGQAIRDHAMLLQSAEELLKQHHRAARTYRVCGSECADPREADLAVRLAAELEAEAATLERYRSQVAAGLASMKKRYS